MSEDPIAKTAAGPAGWARAFNPVLRLLAPLGRAPLATAMVVAAALLCVTVATVALIRSDRATQITTESQARADFVAARLEVYVETRLSLAALIRQEWRDGLIDNRAAFARQASSKLQQFAALQAINWVDPQGVIRWVNPLAGNEPAQNLDVRAIPGPAAALALADSTGTLALTGPIGLAQGGAGFVGYLPVGEAGAGASAGDAAGTGEGFINIVFRADRLFDRVLTPRLRRDYDLVVSDQGRVLYADGALAPESPGYAETDLAIRNRVWRVAVAPTPAFLAAGETPLDEMVLGFGILASLLVAVMIHFAASGHNRLRDERRRLADYAAVSSDWFWEMDAELRFSFLSERFEEVTGVPPATLLGRTRAEVGAPGSDPAAFQRHLKQLRDHEPFRDFMHTRTKADGETVYLAISGTPTFNAAGAFAGYRGIGRDITAQKRSEEALSAALRDAERASQAKSDFLATMSHEFRTPLNAIIGFSDVLGNELFGPIGSARYRAYANDIQDSGQHMLALVNDVLDLAKLESGNRPMAFEAVDLASFLPDCLRPFAAQAEGKDVTLALMPASGLDGLPVLQADRRALTQMIYNLLSNALKFTPSGGRVTLSAEEGAAGAVVLAVRDTGIGISEDGLTRILEPFVQDRAHPHITQDGSGLGLAIVSALAQAHGGHFAIDSTPGAGTDARITLPRGGPAADGGQSVAFPDPSG